MSIFSAKLKTHDRIDLTEQFKDNLNPCKVHGKQPKIKNIIAGRNKESHYVAICEHEDCNKISMESPQIVVDSWNKYNP